jgi:hypothetical protein
MVALLPMFQIRHTIIRMESLRVSHGRSGPIFKTYFPTTGDSEVDARKICGGWCPSSLCALSISIYPFQMSGSSENDSSHRSGGESDRKSSAASSHESELPDSQKRRRTIQIQGRAWVLHGEISTDLLLNNASKTSMDDDADDAKYKLKRAYEYVNGLMELQSSQSLLCYP